MSRVYAKPVKIGAIAALGYLGIKTAVREWRRIDLRRKVVVITGGSRGLGLVLAREFADLGARVAICARDEAELRRAHENFLSSRDNFLTVACDVSDRAQVTKMVAEVRDTLGPIDVLVNNAGTITVAPVENMTIADFEEAMRTHFWGPVYTSLAVMDEMKERRRGRIVNISSIGGKIAVPHLLPYDASKFALSGFSQGLRAELGKYRVWVTTVYPGLMRTGSPRNAQFKGQHRKEYTWFTVGDSIPGASMNARRAARKIVSACVHGDGEVVLGLPAKAAARIHSLMPGIVNELLGLGNRFLMPDPADGQDAPRRGFESETAITRSVLTALTRAAERENNQIH